MVHELDQYCNMEQMNSQILLHKTATWHFTESLGIFISAKIATIFIQVEAHGNLFLTNDF